MAATIPSSKPIHAQPITTGECPIAIVALSDEQVFGPPPFTQVHGSLIVDRVAPGLRPPVQVLATLSMYQQLKVNAFRRAEDYIRKLVPADQVQDCMKQIFPLQGGDMGDVGSIFELIDYFLADAALLAENPNYEDLMALIGNHDAYHRGTFTDGYQFIVGLFLELEGENATYTRDIFGPEVGGTNNALNKKRFLDVLFENYLKKKPNPVTLKSSSSQEYRLADGKTTSWLSPSTFNNFWKKGDKGLYQALVHYDTEVTGRKPEQEWLFVQAAQLGTYTSADNSKQPVFLMGLDSMDYLNQGNSSGALFGHISDIQVQLLQSFMIQMKQQYPGARFVFSSHHPIDQMNNVKASGLAKLLEDPSIIHYLAFHSHNRRHFEANNPSTHEESLLDKAFSTGDHSWYVSRSKKLEVDVMPAVVDYPNEGAFIAITQDHGEPKVEINYVGFEEKKNPDYHQPIDPRKLEIDNMSEAVIAHYEAIKSRLLPHDDIFKRIKNRVLQELSSPEDIGASDVWNLFDTHEGALAQSGRINSLVIKEVVIPGLIEQTKVYLEIFAHAFRLAFQEEGLSENEELLFQSYDNALKQIVDFDKDISALGEDQSIVPHQTRPGIAIALKDLNDKTNKAKIEIQSAIDNDNGKDPAKVKRLKNLLEMIQNMEFYIIYIEGWFQQYEYLVRTGRPPADYKSHSNLFASSHFQALYRSFELYPRGTQVKAFLTLAGYESARQWKYWKNSKIDDLLQKEPLKNKPQTHLVLQSDYVQSSGDNGIGLRIGAQVDVLHMNRPWIPDLALKGTAASVWTDRIFPNEFSLQVAGLLGVPFIPTGLVQGGMLVSGGAIKDGNPNETNGDVFWGWGWKLQLGEVIDVSEEYRTFRNGPPENKIFVGTNLYRLFQYLH